MVSEEPDHLCHATDCDKAVPPAMLMCLKHWRMVPKRLQARVWAEYMPGHETTKTPTGDYIEAAKLAILWVEEAEALKS